MGTARMADKPFSPDPDDNTNRVLFGRQFAFFLAGITVLGIASMIGFSMPYATNIHAGPRRARIHGLLRLQANPPSAGIQAVRSSVFDDLEWHRVR